MTRSARTAVPEWVRVEHHLPLVGDGVTVTAHAEVTLSLDTVTRSDAVTCTPQQEFTRSDSQKACR
jgi:hypothetical protein